MIEKLSNTDPRLMQDLASMGPALWRLKGVYQMFVAASTPLWLGIGTTRCCILLGSMPIIRLGRSCGHFLEGHVNPWCCGQADSTLIFDYLVLTVFWTLNLFSCVSFTPWAGFKLRTRLIKLKLLSV